MKRDRARQEVIIEKEGTRWFSLVEFFAFASHHLLTILFFPPPSITAATDKRTGKMYGPPVGKRLVVFIDDLNMPKKDTYGTQQPIALLLFLLDRGCMYDTGKDLELRYYKDMQYVGAMGTVAGRNTVDPRFLSRFNIFNMTSPSIGVLKLIFNEILTAFFDPFKDSVKAAVSSSDRQRKQIYWERAMERRCSLVHIPI